MKWNNKRLKYCSVIIVMQWITTTASRGMMYYLDQQ